MKYKFTTNPYGQKNVNDFFGVEVLDNSIEALREIAWEGWTPQKIQIIIDKCRYLKDNQEYEYQVPGSDFLMIIDKEKACFFDMHNGQEKADFIWGFSEFIDFMEKFKKFVKENQ